MALRRDAVGLAGIVLVGLLLAAWFLRDANRGPRTTGRAPDAPAIVDREGPPPEVRAEAARTADAPLRSAANAPQASRRSDARDPDRDPSDTTYATIRGIVVDDATGTPVEGARVGGYDYGPKQTTGPQGTFELAGSLLAGRRIDVTHPEYVEWIGGPFVAEPGGVAEGVEVRLSAGGAVEGTVRDVAGAPVEGAAIDLITASAQRRTSTDASGRFRFSALPRGRARLRASAPPESRARLGGRRLFASAAVEEGAVARVDFAARSCEGCSIVGRVTREGNAFRDAPVAVHPGRSTGSPRMLFLEDALRGSTDADGSFRIDGVRAERAVLTVGRPSDSPRSDPRWKWDILVPTAKEHRVEFAIPTGAIGGSVTDGRQGNPVAGVSVAVWNAQSDLSDEHDASTVTDSGGRFLLEELAPGDYFVRSPSPERGGGPEKGRPDGLAFGWKGPVTVGDGRTDVDLTLSPACRASVLVFDPDGKPVPDARALLCPGGSTPQWARRQSAATRDLEAEAQNGRATFTAVPAGRYFALAVHGDFVAAVSEERPITADAETEFRVRLERGTKVRVRAFDDIGGMSLVLPSVRDERGWRLPFLGFGLESIDPADTWTTYGTLRPGRYTLLVSDFTGQTRSLPLEVGSASPLEVVVRFEPDGSLR